MKEIHTLNEYPYRSVVMLVVTYPDGSQARGSGALVGRNDILTGTHVLYSPDKGGWASSISLYAGVDYNSRTNQFESPPQIRLDAFAWEARGWPNQVFEDGSHSTLTWDEAQYDVALLGLSVAIGDQLGWFGMAAGYDWPQWAYQLGYPAEGTGMMYGDAWIERASHYGVYNARSPLSDIMGNGSSGGPLYVYDNGSPYIIGVKTSGSSTESTWADIGFVFDQLMSFIDTNDHLLGDIPAPLEPFTPEEALLRLYIAYFNRAPEYAGLQHWQQQLEQAIQTGASHEQALDWIAEQFWPAASETFSHLTGYTPDMSDFDFVERIYSSVLGRPTASSDDREGIQYWVNELGGPSTRGQLINDLIDGAYDYIAAAPHDPVSQRVEAYLENRLEVAQYFAQQSVSGSLQNDAAIQAGIQALAPVTSDPASVLLAIQLIGLPGNTDSLLG